MPGSWVWILICASATMNPHHVLLSAAVRARRQEASKTDHAQDEGGAGYGRRAKAEAVSVSWPLPAAICT